ncbi:hypothetical protein [Scandinavium hiltneri]|uniref:hypothetical protein n=1 Tax=Scandinavium hiltneri TaxID=2926519 RepID=UPI0028698F26|nr:hypothetical protein [Scandinavium hiltneri]
MYIDNNWTITLQPQKTSFGFVSMQVRTAAKTMGLDVAKMDISQLRRLASCLEKDAYNINLAAMHLRELADYDKLPLNLSMDDIRIIGARYNRGTNPDIESIKKDTRYGDFIVKNWSHFRRLVGR